MIEKFQIQEIFGEQMSLNLVTLFTQCSAYLLGGRRFFGSCGLSR